MQVEPRIDLAKATLAAFALAAVANRFWLHWCSLTLPDAATGVLVAATVAVVSLRPGVNALLCAAWALWCALCLGLLFVLRLDHAGAEVIVALSFCAVLASAAEREAAEALPPAPAPRWARLRALFQTAPAPSWPSSGQPDASSGAARRS